MSFGAYAQTDKDILLEIVKQQTKLSEQQTKLSEQLVATNLEVKVISTELKAFEKSAEKRFDILFYLLVGGVSTIFISIIGLVAGIFWDRRATLKPFETKTDELKLENLELKREIAIIKEKELKLELYIRQISQIDNRFAPFNP